MRSSTAKATNSGAQLVPSSRSDVKSTSYELFAFSSLLLVRNTIKMLFFELVIPSRCVFVDQQEKVADAQNYRDHPQTFPEHAKRGYKGWCRLDSSM